MKVYLLFDDGDHCAVEFLSVWSTMIKAEEEIKKLNESEKDKNLNRKCYIVEKEVF